MKELTEALPKGYSYLAYLAKEKKKKTITSWLEIVWLVKIAVENRVLH